MNANGVVTGYKVTTKEDVKVAKVPAQAPLTAEHKRMKEDQLRSLLVDRNLPWHHPDVQNLLTELNLASGVQVVEPSGVPVPPRNQDIQMGDSLRSLIQLNLQQQQRP